MVDKTDKIWMDGSGSIRYDQYFYSQPLHDPDGKCNLLHGIPFVIMYSPLHRHDRLTFQISNHKLTSMTQYSGDRPVR